MDYPSELLPKNNYTLIETEKIHQKSNLIRISLQTKENTIDDNGDVRIDALIEKSKNIFGYSMYLMGIYKIKHIKINIEDKELNKDWIPGDEIPKRNKIKFTIKKYTNPPIFIEFYNIHNRKFPNCSNPNLKNISIFEGLSKVVHKPTKCNFWHFEIFLYDNGNNCIKSSNSEWKRDAANSFIKSYLKFFATIKKPKNIKIEKSLYCKNKL